LLAFALVMGTAGPAAPLCANGTCCKVCHKGKACGDTCIAVDKVCHKTGGCACDG
jgi:hypothetical protein